MKGFLVSKITDLLVLARLEETARWSKQCSIGRRKIILLKRSENAPILYRGSEGKGIICGPHPDPSLNTLHTTRYAFQDFKTLPYPPKPSQMLQSSPNRWSIWESLRAIGKVRGFGRVLGSLAEFWRILESFGALGRVLERLREFWSSWESFGALGRFFERLGDF